MNANELRLGNYVKFPNNDKPLIVNLRILQLHFSGDTNYAPIPLNADWLLKFRFLHLGIGFVSEDNLLFIYGNKDGKYEIFLYQSEQEDSYLAHFQFVHQLQNLYFALTGKDLTINNNINDQ